MEIIHLELKTDRLSEMKAFYTQKLLLTLLEDEETHFKVAAGASKLTFSAVTDGSKPFYHFAFTIPENKIKEAKEWLSQRVELLKEEGDEIVHFIHWNAHSVYLEDPAGNIVEFICRHYLQNGTNHPFSQNDVLCISEIGLPVDDVLQTADNLQAILGIPQWREPRSTFAPVGDGDGLFIFVAIGRIWFMSDKPAEVFPTRVTVIGERNMHVILQNYHLHFIENSVFTARGLVL